MLKYSMRNGMAKRRGVRPGLEGLEDRVTPTTFHVNTLLDTTAAKVVSLRSAITSLAISSNVAVGGASGAGALGGQGTGGAGGDGVLGLNFGDAGGSGGPGNAGDSTDFGGGGSANGGAGGIGSGGGIFNATTGTLTINPRLGAKKGSKQAKATDVITTNIAASASGGQAGAGGAPRPAPAA